MKKSERIVGYKTEIVEGVGSKLKDLLPNNNPRKGAHCEDHPASHAVSLERSSRIAEREV